MDLVEMRWVMVDIQIIEIRDILTVKRVAPAHGVSPRSLRIRGLDMRNVAEVSINEMKSPSVVVVNNNELLAQVPVPIGYGPIRSVVAISNRLTNTKRSTIKFKVGDSPGFTNGLERLIQSFVKILLQTPGTDAFSPKLGGGLLTAAGKAAAHPQSLVGDVQHGVDRTRRQLIAIQAHDPALALNERLLYAVLLDARFSPQEQALSCKIDIASHAMNSSVVAMEV
jgi:hypothetical protein